MNEVIKLIEKYKTDPKQTLAITVTQLAELPYIPPTSHKESAFRYDVDDNPELNSFLQLQTADRRFGLTKGEKKTFKAVISSKASGKKVFAHLPGQHDQASHGRRGGGPAADLPDGDGDCYVAAVQYMTMVERKQPNQTRRLCHGTVTGQGAIAGIKFGYAWVEEEDPTMPGLTWVIDEASGIQMPAVLYYKIGQIDATQVSRYTAEEMADLLNRNEAYGPWE